MTATTASHPSPVLVRLQTLRQRDPGVFWGAAGALAVIIVLLIAIAATQHSGPSASSLDPISQQVVQDVTTACSTKVDISSVTHYQQTDGTYRWDMTSADDGHAIIAIGTPYEYGNKMRVTSICTVPGPVG